MIAIHIPNCFCDVMVVVAYRKLRYMTPLVHAVASTKIRAPCGSLYSSVTVSLMLNERGGFRRDGVQSNGEHSLYASLRHACAEEITESNARAKAKHTCMMRSKNVKPV